MDLITMILACSVYSNNSITNAMVQLGSQNKALSVAVDGNKAQSFTSADQALKFANDQLAQGHNINVGIMQIPNLWFKQYNVTVAELLLPCKNMVVATEILNASARSCADLSNKNPGFDETACTLSMYKTGDAQAGSDFANSITTYASAHNFDQILAAAKAKNPKEFSMLPGDVATTAATPNAAKINPATDPKRKIPHYDDDTTNNNATNSDKSTTENTVQNDINNAVATTNNDSNDDATKSAPSSNSSAPTNVAPTTSPTTNQSDTTNQW